jgi:hypothetical protein
MMPVSHVIFRAPEQRRVMPHCTILNKYQVVIDCYEQFWYLMILLLQVSAGRYSWKPKMQIPETSKNGDLYPNHSNCPYTIALSLKTLSVHTRLGPSKSLRSSTVRVVNNRKFTSFSFSFPKGLTSSEETSTIKISRREAIKTSTDITHHASRWWLHIIRRYKRKEKRTFHHSSRHYTKRNVTRTTVCRDLLWHSLCSFPL